eukprot:scaffold1307_cov200-Pinguiococcus_pyrenoidosus.AAC.38
MGYGALAKAHDLIRVRTVEDQNEQDVAHGHGVEEVFRASGDPRVLLPNAGVRRRVRRVQHRGGQQRTHRQRHQQQPLGVQHRVAEHQQRTEDALKDTKRKGHQEAHERVGKLHRIHQLEVQPKAAEEVREQRRSGQPLTAHFAVHQVVRQGPQETVLAGPHLAARAQDGSLLAGCAPERHSSEVGELQILRLHRTAAFVRHPFAVGGQKRQTTTARHWLRLERGGRCWGRTVRVTF